MKTLAVLIGFVLAFSNGEVRIAGGADTDISRYPFAAALLTDREQRGRYVQECGGSIITASAILTAASCFYSDETPNEPRRWRARVGSSYANAGGSVHLIRTITPHPDFQPATRLNDVAVLRPTISFNLQPGFVEVARLSGGAFQFEEEVAVTAIGWGAPQANDSSGQLREVDIWPVNLAVCAGRYSSIGVQVTDIHVCVGWIDVGVRGQCEGDNGSPLVRDSNIVVGVFSWAQGCADIMYPGINTRVAPFTDWIVATALA